MVSYFMNEFIEKLLNFKDTFLKKSLEKSCYYFYDGTPNFESLKTIAKIKEIHKITFQNNFNNIYLKQKILLKNKKIIKSENSIIIEHTSANPTGFIHLGNIRNSIIGDSIKGIHEKFYKNVTTEYYVNDLNHSVIGLYLLRLERPITPLPILYNEYTLNRKKYNTKVLNTLKKLENELDPKYIKFIDYTLNLIKNSLLKVGINFTKYVKESSFSRKSKKLLKKLKNESKTNLTDPYYMVIDNKTTYLTRSNGTNLYIVNDIIHGIQKINKYTSSIIVLSEDHKKYINVYKEVLSKININTSSLKFITYRYMNLNSQKLSKRNNLIYSIDEMIVDSEKYLIHNIINYSKIKNKTNLITMYIKLFLLITSVKKTIDLKIIKTKVLKAVLQILSSNKKALGISKNRTLKMYNYCAEFPFKYNAFSFLYSLKTYYLKKSMVDPSIYLNYILRIIKEYNRIYESEKFIGTPNEKYGVLLSKKLNYLLDEFSKIYNFKIVKLPDR